MRQAFLRSDGDGEQACWCNVARCNMGKLYLPEADKLACLTQARHTGG